MDLRDLTALSGVSGNEQAVRRALLEALKPLCDSVSIDRMGNVIAFKKGTKSDKYPKVALAAHMDEVGFIITSVTKDGLLKFQCAGGIDPRVIVSKRVLIGEEKVPGVIGATAIHLQTVEDRKRVLGYDALYIDIGAKTQEEAEKDCPAGSYVVFDTPYREFGEGFICAKALDDRVGCFTMLEVLKETYPCDVTCCFNSEEEVGCRGGLGSAFATEAEFAIILEGTTANDLGDVNEVDKVCRLGQGVAISFMDRASIVNTPLFKRMNSLAEEKKIPHQIKTAVAGGNESGPFQRQASGKKTVVLSVPCRYIHSPSSVVKYEDVLSQQALVKAFLNDPRV